MNEPLKIIYKYKNDNRKYQYLIYVHIGSVSNEIMKILDKIKDLSLYDTLSSLAISEINDLSKFYGNGWYTFFFNKYHIQKISLSISQNKQMENDIRKKYGDEFINNLISKSKRTSEQRKYTYGMVTKRDLVHHEIRTRKRDYTDEMTDDYQIRHDRYSQISKDTENIERESESSLLQSGGEVNEEEQTDISDENDATDNSFDNYESGTDDDDEISQDDLEKLYSEETVSSKELEKTTSLIKKVLNDENIMKKKETKMIKFDMSKDTNMYKENLADVYVKNYIKDQYILPDDTIKNIKNKICCGIKNHSKFGKKSYLIPSRQYLWGEYLFNDKYDKIMIGSKFTQKNELLNIDVEPNENIKVYDELRDTMRKLRDELKRFNSNIKRIDEENKILIDYLPYIDNHELYLLDIYNELGKMYKPPQDALNNLIDTYIKLYFPRIQSTEIKNIIDYLNEGNDNNSGSVEREKIIVSHDIINTDLILENEITMMVERLKIRPKYAKIMKGNFVTQSMINLLLRSEDTENFRRIDLFKIFDEFIPNKTYPFIQYMEPSGQIAFKFCEEEIDEYIKDKNFSTVISSWLQNISHGISFRVRTDDMTTTDYRFMTINLNEVGKIDYKIQWKEDDHASVDDISKTYEIIRKLIEEINNTTIKYKFEMPKEDEFNTAFITTIQHFELDKEYNINHNDLSTFARYFYPYFALVIEPRKRVSKIHESETKSKFGTYLRYKRITNYENIAKIEQKIYYYMRNYEFTEQTIIDEISKQFNITQESATEHLKRTMQKYSHIKKARKKLKKFDKSPKYKSPGIDVEILGKTKDKYKIRISGARNKNQLHRIIEVLNILLYSYSETYLAKKTEWQHLKDKLKKLNNIAERRHIVNDYVRYSEDKLNIKLMANADKRRIGYKPEKGQSHWTRVCQNSGNTQRRRPQQYTIKNIDEMLKLGYKLNKSTGMYERKIVTTKRGHKDVSTIKAVKLNELDPEGNAIGNEIYYTCSPEQNGIHMYVGFLTKSKNPNGEPMPCCFKKDQASSSNEDKKNFFMKSIGHAEELSEQSSMIADQLYILQDTNKIQANRYGFLPKVLSFYLNTTLNLHKTIIQHYLTSAPDGYYFKYGIEHGDNSFLSAIASVLDMTVENIIETVNNKIAKDKHELIFTALNNGEIKTYFKSSSKYLSYLKNIKNIDYDMIYHILTIPNMITKNGLNIIVFYKLDTKTKYDENDLSKSDCQILCQNNEELSNIFDTTRENILLYKENDSYYPILNVRKENDKTREYTITKTYTYNKSPNNIIEHIREYYFKNCMEKTIKSIVEKENAMTAKELIKKLTTLKDDKYKPISQYVDSMNKCRFMITKNNLLIPVTPSGSIYNLNIVDDIEKYYGTFSETLKNIDEIFKLMDGKIPVKPFGVGGKQINDNKFEIITIILQNNESIPIKKEIINISDIKKNNLVIDTSSHLNDIDNFVQNPTSDVLVDDRIETINYSEFKDESYELFKFTFSEHINKKDNVTLKEKLKRILTLNKKLERKDIIRKLRLFLYKIVDSELANIYKGLINDTENEEVDTIEQNGGKSGKFIQIVKDVPNLDKYVVNNTREMCEVNNDKNKCAKNFHCKWIPSGNCLLAITNEMAVMFINKMSAEMIDNEMKRKEILQEDNYYISNVVDKRYYTERLGQKVIKTSKDDVKKNVELSFGSDKISGMIELDKKKKKLIEQKDNELLENYPLKDYGSRYLQNIIPNNNTIIRAYVNGFYWNENKYQDENVRNLGYYCQKQTDLMLYFKSIIINWLLDKKNEVIADELLQKYSHGDTLYKYIVKLSSNVTLMTTGFIEYYVLNQIQKVPIVIYVDESVHTVFDKTIKRVEDEKLDKFENNKNYINIQFAYGNNEMKTDIPRSVDIIYFK